MSNKLKEVKKSEESKNAATLKILSRKEKELEETLLREQKLLGQVDTLKDEAKKMESQHKERADAAKKLESNLRIELQEVTKKGEKVEEELTLRLESQGRELAALEENFSEQKDMLARTVEREMRFKQEVQTLTQQMIYFEENKQLLAEYEEKLKDYDKRIDELSDELRTRELKETHLSKQIADLKDKLVEAENDRIKKDTSIKEKDKLLSTTSKQAALELD